MVTFYSDNPSLNAIAVYSFYSVKLLEKNKKRPGWPIFNSIRSYSSSTSSSCSLSPSPTPTPTSSPWKDKENDPVIVLQETLPSPILKGRKTFFGLSHVLLGLLSCFLAFSRSTNVLSVRGLFDLLSGSFWLSSFTFWSLIVHLISILGFHLSFWHFIVSFGLF